MGSKHREVFATPVGTRTWPAHMGKAKKKITANLFSRLNRVVTGHAPIGAFREHFNKEGSQDCPCSMWIQTRDHLLFDCLLTIPFPKFMVGPDRLKWLNLLDTFYKLWPDLLITWLELNPFFFIFQFGELHEHASEEDITASQLDLDHPD